MKFINGESSKNLMASKNYEMLSGEWNTIDLYCLEQTSFHQVNGECVMIIRNSGSIKDGKIIPLVRGRIQIQSQGADLFIKEIKIRWLEKLDFDYRYRQ